MEQLAQDDYSQFVPEPAQDTDPALASVSATEQASPMEQDIRDDLISDFTIFLYDQEGREDIITSLDTAPELYQGVSSLVYNINKKYVDDMKSEGNDVPSSVIFGEGGLIHAGVDEVFALAQQSGVVGADDPEQYSAAIFDVYRMVGEHIQDSGDDASIAEAQGLMVDIESDGRGGQLPEELDVGISGEEELAIEDHQAGSRSEQLILQQQEQEAMAEEQALQEQQMTPEAIGLQLPTLPPLQGGGVLGGGEIV